MGGALAGEAQLRPDPSGEGTARGVEPALSWDRTCKSQGGGGRGPEPPRTRETTLVALKDDDCSTSLTGARPHARRGHSPDLVSLTPPFPFSYPHIPTPQFPSLSLCREQTSRSTSLNPSALSPSHSSTSESRAPETSKGRGAQDCGGPGPGVGEGLGMGGAPARIPEKIGPRETEAWIAKESDFRDTALLPALQSLLYADLDHVALSQPCRLNPVVPADSSTIYAVVV